MSQMSNIANRYQVIAQIGQGGMGEVYRVKHKFTGEVLALKVLKDDLIQREAAEKQERDRRKGQSKRTEPEELKESQWAMRFQREMKISAKIGSEHVVRITDADCAPELGGAYFYVMELLNGADLDRILRERASFSPEEVVWLIGQVAQGLDKAHSLGIIHRDMKPANLFLHVRPNGNLILKILDFGLAFLHSDGPNASGAQKLTETGASLGTLNYFSPEQAMGERELIGPGTDIWAVGVIVFELLTGDTYFPGREPSVLFKIATAQLTEPSSRHKNLSVSFDHWFFRSCDKDPKKRWRTVAEQARELAKALCVDEALSQSDVAPSSLKGWAATRPVSTDTSQLDVSVDMLALTEQQQRAPNTLIQAATAPTPAAPTIRHSTTTQPLLVAMAIAALGFLALAILLLLSRGTPRPASDPQASPQQHLPSPPSNADVPSQPLSPPIPPKITAGGASATPVTPAKPKTKRVQSISNKPAATDDGEFRPRAP